MTSTPFTRITPSLLGDAVGWDHIGPLVGAMTVKRVGFEVTGLNVGLNRGDAVDTVGLIAGASDGDRVGLFAGLVVGGFVGGGLGDLV